MKIKDLGLIGGFEVGRYGVQSLTLNLKRTQFSCGQSTRREEIAVSERVLRCIKFSVGVEDNLFKSILLGVGVLQGGDLGPIG